MIEERGRGVRLISKDEVIAKAVSSVVFVNTAATRQTYPRYLNSDVSMPHCCVDTLQSESYRF